MNYERNAVFHFIALKTIFSKILIHLTERLSFVCKNMLLKISKFILLKFHPIPEYFLNFALLHNLFNFIIFYFIHVYLSTYLNEFALRLITID